MASLSSAKTLGGVGAILAIIPGLSLVGWILILVAMKDISDVTQDRSIFNDALIATLTAIVGSIALVLVFAFGAFGGLITLGLVGFGPLGFVGAFGLLGTLWAVLIVSSIFLKRAYDKIAQRLNVGSFATAGLLYLIGAITTIVLVGFLILLIAMIFQIVAYFSIQDQPAPSTYYGYPPPQPVPGPTPVPPPQTMQPQATPAPPPQVTQPQATPTQQSVPEFKYCFKCGTRLAYNAVFCTNCGTKQ